nr:microtubule-associated tyrosine carboxypeptidase-like [Lytechinus pictus]
MIAIESLPIDTSITPLKQHHLLNRRGKLTRSKLRPVARPKSIQRNPDGLSCSQLTPVQPSSPQSVLCVADNKSVASVSSTGKCPRRKLKSGDTDNKKVKPPGMPGKLPRIKKKDEGLARKSGRRSSTAVSASEHSDSQYHPKNQTQRQSLKNESITEDGDKAKPQKKKTKSVYILEAIKPNNVQSEKEKFMRLRGRYNPEFEYDNPASEKVMKSYSQASNKLVPQALRIMETALDRYGSYEAFEEAIAGARLTETEFTGLFKGFVNAEGLDNQVYLNLTPDLLSRAVMTRLRSRPTMNVNSKVLRRGWARGLLQHEIGTHYMRSANNRYQPWHNNRGRKRHKLLPMNPTEEGLASLHSVLGRDDPCLWRSAMLYYTVYQASLLPFRELFEHLSRFIQSPEVRWDYCMRAKRGQVDTSKPGCFNKDQVYLNGALQVLRFRFEIDFHALVKMGRVAYQDIERLRNEAVFAEGVVSVPSFMADKDKYLQNLNEIRLKNRLTDKDLCEVFPVMESCT